MAGQSTNYYDNTWSMTLDTQGNVYVLCYTVRQDGLNPIGVLVFGPGANGDATPVRYITTPGMSTGYYGDPTGVLVDQAGTLYVSASPPEDADAKLFIFPQGVSGSVTPSRIITTPNSFHTRRNPLVVQRRRHRPLSLIALQGQPARWSLASRRVG